MPRSSGRAFADGLAVWPGFLTSLHLPSLFLLHAWLAWSGLDWAGVQLMAPRQGYLHVVASQAWPHLQHVLPSFPGRPGPPRPWFDCSGVPLKWYLPCGVLYDLLADVGQLPWRLTVHYTHPPDALVSWDTGATPQAQFMNSLKEAGYICRGTEGSGAVMRMGSAAQEELWSAVQACDVGSYRTALEGLKVAPTPRQGQPPNIPVRLLLRRALPASPASAPAPTAAGPTAAGPTAAGPAGPAASCGVGGVIGGGVAAPSPSDAAASAAAVTAATAPTPGSVARGVVAATAPVPAPGSTSVMGGGGAGGGGGVWELAILSTSRPVPAQQGPGGEPTTLAHVLHMLLPHVFPQQPAPTAGAAAGEVRTAAATAMPAGQAAAAAAADTCSSGGADGGAAVGPGRGPEAGPRSPAATAGGIPSAGGGAGGGAGNPAGDAPQAEGSRLAGTEAAGAALVDDKTGLPAAMEPHGADADVGAGIGGASTSEAAGGEALEIGLLPSSRRLDVNAAPPGLNPEGGLEAGPSAERGGEGGGKATSRTWSGPAAGSEGPALRAPEGATEQERCTSTRVQAEEAAPRPAAAASGTSAFQDEAFAHAAAVGAPSGAVLSRSSTLAAAAEGVAAGEAVRSRAAGVLGPSGGQGCGVPGTGGDSRGCPSSWPLCRVLVGGICPPLEAPIGWLHAAMHSPDLFLYVVVRMDLEPSGPGAAGPHGAGQQPAI